MGTWCRIRDPGTSRTYMLRRICVHGLTIKRMAKGKKGRTMAILPFIATSKVLVQKKEMCEPIPRSYILTNHALISVQ